MSDLAGRLTRHKRHFTPRGAKPYGLDIHAQGLKIPKNARAHTHARTHAHLLGVCGCVGVCVACVGEKKYMRGREGAHTRAGSFSHCAFPCSKKMRLRDTGQVGTRCPSAVRSLLGRPRKPTARVDAVKPPAWTLRAMEKRADDPNERCRGPWVEQKPTVGCQVAWLN